MSSSEITTNDLNNLYDNPIDDTSDESGLNARLQTMNNSLKEIEEVEKNGLSRQSDIKNIISKESDRLEQKKTTIDRAILAQNRIIYFNDNSRKIYAAYLKILIIAVITLGVVYVLLLIKKHFEFIPDFIIEILIIITISTGIIIMYLMYEKIRYRNTYNFDEIDYAAPTQRPEYQKISGSDLTYETDNVCVGPECCKPSSDSSPGAIWDESIGKCVSNADEINPTEPFEYDNYSKYK